MQDQQLLLIIVHRSYMRGVHVKRKFKYVNEFCHTIGLFQFIGPANGYTHTLRIHSAITNLGYLVCFSRVSFANSTNSQLRQWDPWRALHGRHGSEIHPSNRETTFGPFEHNGWHFCNSQLVQTVIMEGLTWLQLPTLPLHLPHLLPPAHHL